MPLPARYLAAAAKAGFPMSPSGAARGSLPPQYYGPYSYDPYSNQWINPQTGDPVAGELNPSGSWTPPGDLPSGPSEFPNQGGNMDLGGYWPEPTTGGFQGYQSNAPDMSFGSALPESPFSGPSPGIQLGPEYNFNQPSWGELGSLPNEPWSNAQFPSYQAGMVSPSDLSQTVGQFADPSGMVPQGTSGALPSPDLPPIGNYGIPFDTGAGQEGGGGPTVEVPTSGGWFGNVLDTSGWFGPGGINSAGFSNVSGGSDVFGNVLDTSGATATPLPGYAFDAQGNVVQTDTGGSGGGPVGNISAMQQSFAFGALGELSPGGGGEHGDTIQYLRALANTDSYVNPNYYGWGTGGGRGSGISAPGGRGPIAI
jgi:hypothetical protein